MKYKFNLEELKKTEKYKRELENTEFLNIINKSIPKHIKILILNNS